MDRYLIRLRNGFRTKLSEAYEEEVLRRTGAATLESASEDNTLCGRVSKLGVNKGDNSYRYGCMGSKSATPKIWRKIPGVIADRGLMFRAGALAKPLIR